MARRAVLKVSTVRARSARLHDRLDAHYFTAPGVAASERIAVLEAAGLEIARLGDIANVWDPSRFARAWAAPSEEGVPYLRPYDVFSYLPVSSSRLSVSRTASIDRLVPAPGTLLQTCSGRNLGPCTYADEHIAQFALSHDMIRIEIDDEDLRPYVFAFLKTPTGQALLRRGKSGSVIDHLTTDDVADIPVPLVKHDLRAIVAQQAQRAAEVAAVARKELTSLLAAQEAKLPMPSRSGPLREGWTMPASTIRGRLDAAYYDPLVAESRSQLANEGAVSCRELATVFQPGRYKRYYVSSEHGKPILSGTQLLQLDPINLRYVASRSFNESAEYEIQSDMTIFAADGRAQGSQGRCALVTTERSGWLASEHVMRLRPRSGVRPGAIWLALSTRQVRAQINALSFGSVIDELRPVDIEQILLPQIDDKSALRAERAWAMFSKSTASMADAALRLEEELAPHTAVASSA
jgi:hypothetical protein